MILKCHGWPCKTIGHLFNDTSSFVHQFIAIGHFKLELQSGRLKICFDLCGLDLWPLTSSLCTDITFVNGNNSWKFHDDLMTEEYSAKCVTDGQTDGRTNRSVLRAAWLQLKIVFPHCTQVNSYGMGGLSQHWCLWMTRYLYMQSLLAIRRHSDTQPKDCFHPQISNFTT